MRIEEITQQAEQLDEVSLKKGLISLALAGALGTGFASIQNRTTPKADAQLTTLGRDAIQNLPPNIKKYIGDPNTIIFVKGIPKGGDPNAVCQVAKGTRTIFVNPKYVDQFISGASDQLSAHELTHIAQQNFPSSEQNRFPKDNVYDLFGDTAKDNAWQILKKKRANGDRMWDHSEEEQAMIVQQREAAIDSIKNLQKYSSNPNVAGQIDLAKQKLAVYDQYISDLK